MKVNYFPDTDSLYIDLSERPSAESREISESVVLDYDASGNLVGIDIDNASTKVDLHRFVVSKIPRKRATDRPKPKDDELNACLSYLGTTQSVRRINRPPISFPAGAGCLGHSSRQSKRRPDRRHLFRTIAAKDGPKLLGRHHGV
jgi:uncharacterized protein YuzE